MLYLKKQFPDSHIVILEKEPEPGMHASDKHPVVKTNIYPVPDLKYPFLGAHFTVDVYGIIVLKISVLKKYLKILMHYSSLFLNNDFGFRDIAIQ